jgi:hypothetical protein
MGNFRILGVGQHTREAARGMAVHDDAAERRARKRERDRDRRNERCRLEAVQEARRLGLTLWAKDWEQGRRAS